MRKNRRIYLRMSLIDLFVCRKENGVRFECDRCEQDGE